MPFLPDQQSQPPSRSGGKFVPDQPKQASYPVRTGRALADYVRAAASKPWQIPIGVAEQALSMGTGMIAAPVNDFWNAGMEALELPTKDMISAYQPRTEVGGAMVRAGSEMMSPVAAAVDYATDIENPEPGVRATGRLIRGTLGVLPFVGAKGLPKRAPPLERPAPIPAAELRTQANAAFQRAREAGRGEIVRQDSLGNFAQRTEKVLAGEDFAFDPKLEPMTAYSYNLLMEEATKPGIVGHSPQGLEILRRKMLKAEGQAQRSATGADDARQVGRIIDDFDDWADNLIEGRDVLTSGARTAESIAARTQARELWSRMKRTQTIENLIERAQTTSPALTQTGLENALRIQFKQLALNERRMRQFSAEERAAIKRVAEGGRLQQVARRAAGLAPRGSVSAMGSVVLGGTTGAGAIPFVVVGEAGALAARLMRLGDVEAARSLISNPRGTAPAAQRPVIAAPVAGAVRASTAIPPALSAEVVDRQRNALYRDDERRRNSLAR